jgi:hypothetical protein
MRWTEYHERPNSIYILDPDHSADRRISQIRLLMKKCAICKEPYEGLGYNAWPVAEGRCCEVCDTIKVTPARIDAARKRMGLPQLAIYKLDKPHGRSIRKIQGSQGDPKKPA